jgi:Protein of unknown function (DUF2889)
VRISTPAQAGPQNPVGSAPDRRPGSVRRTTTIDTTRPEGLEGPLTMRGVARDLLTTPGGEARELAAANLVAHLTAEHQLTELITDPALPGSEALLGAVVGPGFRAKALAALPAEAEAGTLLNLLLDDLPGAALVSGFARLAASSIPKPAPHDEYLDARGDLCAGWAVDGTMMTIIREDGENPMTIGPLAPPLLREDDPAAWHAFSPLPPHSTRRLRRLDVIPPAVPGAPATVDVFFRDSHADGEAVERVVHEYTVGATIDPATATLVDIAATADVLPWRECPGAVASATRLAGMPVGDLRRHVREQFTGTTTCTHLNDVLRGLADLGVLVPELGG